MMLVNAVIAVAVIMSIVKGMEMYVKYYDKRHPEWRDTAHPAA